MIFVADTDIGTVKELNQDSIVVKHGVINGIEVIMAILCDGMGGLSKGEFISHKVTEIFGKWFNDEAFDTLNDYGLSGVIVQWKKIILYLNEMFLESGKKGKYQMGTTFTGMMIYDNQYIILHIGDSRVYELENDIKQLTHDHTYVQRELEMGNMSLEEAENDVRKHILLQCLGASESIEPEVIIGNTINGAYCICSDGFRNLLSDSELRLYLNPDREYDKEKMRKKLRYIINVVKDRGETDNISAILIVTARS